jgi:hypothetical protein
MKKSSWNLLLRTVTLLTGIFSALPGWAALPDAEEDFADSQPLQDKDLAKLRGGFSLPSGIVVHFTYTSSLNGVTQTQFSSDDLASAIRTATQKQVADTLAKAGIKPPETSNTNTVTTQTTTQNTSVTPPPAISTNETDEPEIVPEITVIAPPPPPVQAETPFEIFGTPSGPAPAGDIDIDADSDVGSTPPVDNTPPVQPEAINVPDPVIPPASTSTTDTTNASDFVAQNQAADIMDAVVIPNLSTIIQNSENNVHIQFEQQLDLTLSNTQLAIDSQVTNNVMSQAALMNAMAIK